ncbi:MAG: replication initiation protein [Clostridia bacterium]|nr:replication initiation protein [Clostridia bacterium]
MSLPYEYEQLEFERTLEVCKRNDLIQQSRFTLTVQEQRMVLYAISKIKPDDETNTEYEISLNDLYKIAGINHRNYASLKDSLRKLDSKNWWAEQTDENGEMYETLVRWFAKIIIKPNSSVMKIKFHEEMAPYIFQLVQSGAFYTTYNLEYVLPMKSQYSPRLYEILKSYQYNNNEWYFDTDKLKKLLDCEKYERYPDFRRYVLEPAVEEINLYTDLKICYNVETKGRKVVRIVFCIDKKTIREMNQARDARSEVTGQLTYDDIFDITAKSPEAEFWQERRKTKDNEEADHRRKMEELLGKGKK